MVESEVRTGVDALLDLLRSVEKIPLSEAADKLHLTVETLQAWVDFLVEERIVGIEYTFTKPYIYLNKQESKEKKVVKVPKLKELKKEYEERARKKKIPAEKVAQLWEAHVEQELSYLEPFFKEQAQRRGVQDTRECRMLWDEYSARLMQRLRGVE